jgi:hypothetical protein
LAEAPAAAHEEGASLESPYRDVQSGGLGRLDTPDDLASGRFGVLSSGMTARLNQLSSKQLNELSEALFDFKTSADLEIWFSRYNAQ